MKRTFLITLFAALSLMSASAQTSRTLYHVQGINNSHELNPAFQPDSSYLTIPLLGNTSFSWMTSMKLGDIIFERPDGTLTTFMSPDAIGKSDLMDRVGDGMKTNMNMRFTLFGMGKRISEREYRTLDVSFRTDVSAFAPKDLFGLLKDVDNGTYNLTPLSLSVSSYFEAAFGESMRINDKLTVGGKAKVLLGLVCADVNVRKLNVNVQDADQWSTQADVETQLFGLDYKTKLTDYKSKPGQFEQVNSAKLDGLGIKGIGLALDLGAEYRYDERWTFSAAVLDLGFISWFGGNKAANKEKSFTFDGFRDISTSKSDPNSLKNQGDRLQDDLLNMAHLERDGKASLTKMLSCTLEGAAAYRIDQTWNVGALLTANINSPYGWSEARVNVNYTPYIKIGGVRSADKLCLTLSPSVNTFGFGMGGAVTFRPGKWQLFLSTDNLFTQFTHQLLPTAHNATVQFGVAKQI